MSPVIFNDGNIPIGYWRYLVYGDPYYVAIADDGSVAKSSDGINFVSINTTNTSQPVALAYNSPNFVVFYADGSIATSVDLESWAIPSTYLLNNATGCGGYSNGLFVTFGSELPTVGVSSDGISWDSDVSNLVNDTYFFLTGTDTYLYTANNDNLFYGHLLDWSPVLYNGDPLHDTITCVCQGGGQVVALSASGGTYYSGDGINFIQGGNFSEGTYTWNSVAYGNGHFIAVADEGYYAIAPTPDSLWVVYPTPMNGPRRSIIYSDSLFVDVGQDIVSYGIFANFDFVYGVPYEGVYDSGTWTSNNIITNIPLATLVKTVGLAEPAYWFLDSENSNMLAYLSGFEEPNGPLTLTFVAPQPFVVPGTSWYINADLIGSRLLYDVSNPGRIDGTINMVINGDTYPNIKITKNPGQTSVALSGSLDNFPPIICTLNCVDFQYSTTYYGVATTSNTLEFKYFNPLPAPVRVISDDDGPPMVVSLSSNACVITAVFDSNVNFNVDSAYSYRFVAPAAFSLDNPYYILGDGTALAYSVIVPSPPTPLTGLCSISGAPVRYTITNGFVLLSGTVPRNPHATQYDLFSTVYQPMGKDVYCQFDRSDNLDNGYVNSADNLTTAWAYNTSAPGIYLQRVSPNIISNTYLNIQFRKNSNVGMDLCGIGIVNSSNISGDPRTRLDVLIYLAVNGNVYINGAYVENIEQSFNNNDSVLLNMDVQNHFFQFFSSGNGASRQYETAPFSGSDLYVFASFQNMNSGSFTIQYPNLYSQYELSTARMIPYKYPGLYPDIGTIYLTTPTAIGVRWPDKTSSNDYQIQTINTNSGRVVGDDDVGGGSFIYKNGLEPDSKYNMMIQYNGDSTWYPLLSGIDTAILGKNLPFINTDFQNINISLHDITKVPSPWMICVTELQIAHPISLPIKNYNISCPTIGLEQSFKYQGKTFEFITTATNSTLGTPIPHDFSKFPDPNNLEFTLTYDTPYGSKNQQFNKNEITFFSMTAYIYTYQLFLYGIN